MNEKEPIKFENTINSPEKGRDIVINILVVRHGKKDEVGNLSPSGREGAEDMGREKTIPKNGIKFYTSPFNRTRDTLKALIQGIKEQNGENRIFKSRVRYELAPPRWTNFEMFIKKANEIRKIEGDRGLFKYIFSEPSIQGDLEKWSSGLAFLINEYRKMAPRLYSNSNVELSHITHDILIEDFLKKVAILKDEKGNRITLNNLDIIDGDIKPLEGFNLRICLDVQKRETLKIFFRGREFDIDEDRLNKLVNEFKESPYKGRTET
jgi:hypothetical protein